MTGKQMGGFQLEDNNLNRFHLVENMSIYRSMGPSLSSILTVGSPFISVEVFSQIFSSFSRSTKVFFDQGWR